MRGLWDADRAIGVVSVLAHALGSASVRFAVVGSLRRKKTTVRDIDLVVSSLPSALLALKSAGAVVPRQHGMVYAVCHVRSVQIDMYEARTAYWGASLLYYTGPRHYVLNMQRIAGEAGLALNRAGVWLSGARVAGVTELEIFELLGLTFVAPEDRR